VTHGYRLPVPGDANTDGDPRTEFEWEVPSTYNIAAVALEQDASRTALEHVAVDGNRRMFTYGDLDEASAAIAGYLHTVGIESGDRIAVCLPQCPEHLFVHLAAYRLGAVVVPISMLLGQETFEYQLSHGDVQVLFIDAERRTAVPDDVVSAVDNVVEVEPCAADDTELLGGLATAVTAQQSTNDWDVAPTAPDDPAVLLYTSGTSGHPRGVLQGHSYLLGSLPGYHCSFHLFTGSECRAARAWTPSEWAWAGALFDVVFPTLAVGGTVLSTERRSGFDPDRALDAIEHERVTHAFLPPTALARLRAEATPDTYDLSSLSVIQAGGEQLPPAVFEWAEEALDVTVNEAYGQTEANFLVGNCQRCYEAKPGSIGKPYPGHGVAVVDENGHELPPGELGELVIEPPDPVTLLEYWRDPEATEAKFFDDGRMRTGDLARQDEDGYLWHAGRRDDLIVSAGYRISPLEVESALADNPRVADVVVGGVPDAERGQRVKAYVVLTEDTDEVDNANEHADVLKKHVRKRLGTHKGPHEVAVIESIPKTRSGKIDRDALFPD
jgi:acetyl-CoA synthetase